MPLVPIPHPLADNLAPLVAAKAEAIAAEVIANLVGDAEAVAEANQDRFVRLTQRRLEGGALCLDDACAIDLAMTGSPATTA